jgi:hypothetical protein
LCGSLSCFGSGNSSSIRCECFLLLCSCNGVLGLSGSDSFVMSFHLKLLLCSNSVCFCFSQSCFGSLFFLLFLLSSSLGGCLSYSSNPSLFILLSLLSSGSSLVCLLFLECHGLLSCILGSHCGLSFLYRSSKFLFVSYCDLSSVLFSQLSLKCFPCYILGQFFGFGLFLGL